MFFICESYVIFNRSCVFAFILQVMNFKVSAGENVTIFKIKLPNTYLFIIIFIRLFFLLFFGRKGRGWGKQAMIFY